MVESIEDIIWETWEEVDDEPGLEIIDPYDFGIGDNLPSRTDICRMEVEYLKQRRQLNYTPTP